MELAIYLNDINRYRGKRFSRYECVFADAKRNGVCNAYKALEDYMNDDIEYFYFGNEFCEYLIPTQECLEQWIRLCTRDGLRPVFITPVVSEYGIDRVRASIIILQRVALDFTVVVNDYGVIHMITAEFPEIRMIAGRILDKMSHDPRAYGTSLQDYYGDEGIHYATEPGNVSQYSLKVLKKLGFQRFEYDLPKVGIRLYNNELAYSLYWPFNYLTTGRVCLFRSMGRERVEKFLVNNAPCIGFCQQFELELRKPLTGFQTSENRKIDNMYLFQKGNTIYYLYEEKDIKEILNLFNRLIVQIL